MPNEEVSDEELLLRKRARRRLIGAFVVVIAMVLILPAALEDKPQPVSQDVEIVLPPPASAPNPPAAAIEPSASMADPPTPAPAPTPVMEDKPRHAEPKVTQNPAQKDVPPAAEPAKRPASPERAEVKPKTPNRPSSDRFLVQVGVFSNSENVKQLQAKLSAQGVKAHSETLADGKIRVRAGPYPTRQEAERMVDKIRSAGVSAVVVKVAGKP